MLHALEIAGMVCPNNVFLAPMAGYTNLPFRAMCERLGAGLSFTEMVSAKGLHYNNDETHRLLAVSLDETTYPLAVPSGEPTYPLAVPSGETMHPLAVPSGESTREAGERGSACPPPVSSEPTPRAAQIFGSDPFIMREACESEALAPFDLIDINMGCPMPKIVKNGEGSALMENLPLAEQVISECVKSGKRISVKFRTGIHEGDKMAVKFAKMCEGAGACMVTVHGRVREKIYAGPVDYDQIAAVKAAVKIPVIGNGGIANAEDAEKMFSTGVDGVMIARAALYRPTIFSTLTGRDAPPLSELFLRQLDETEALCGEHFACVFLRKMAAFYLKGTRGANALKARLFSVTSTAQLRSMVPEIFS